MRRLTRLLACATVVVGLVVPLAGPAAADEVYTVPPDGVFTFDGHGWGHGHGMSQWGAQGAATQGLDRRAILDFYYPGTQPGTAPSVALKVALTDLGAEGVPPSSGAGRYQCDDAAGGRDYCTLNVANAPGLLVTDRASGRTWQDSGYRLWGVKVAADGLVLTRLDDTGWAHVATGLAGPLEFTGPPTVRVAYADGTSRDYRGTVSAVRTGASRFIRLNVVGIEDYLRGVVPRESPASWLPAALQAQAVAARSYALNVRASNEASGAAYDICDSTWCQVYGGAQLVDGSGNTTRLEADSTDAAVSATAGEVRTYAGQPIFAQFASSDGGWTAAGGQPYLVAEADPYDGMAANPVHDWTATVSAASLQAAYPAVGTLLRIRVTQRDGNGDWGGRVVTAVLEGVDASGAPTSVTVTRPRFGMRSEWWRIHPEAPVVTGPATAARGSTVTLSGTAPPGWVELWLQPRGAADPRHVANTRTDADGGFSFALFADVDYSYYVVAQQVRSATASTQVQGTTLKAPSQAPTGDPMTLQGLAAPGSQVQVAVADLSGQPVAGSPVSTTADGRGRWSAAYTPTTPGADTITAQSAGYSSPSLTTQVYVPVELTGPSPVARGSVVRLTGSAQPGARVVVWFHKQFVPGYTPRRWLTADSSGAFSTTYVADVDYRYYATEEGTVHVSSPGLTQAHGTTLAGPPTVPRGSTVRIGGLAAPGSRVVVWFHKQFVPGYTARRWLRADASGRWSTTYVADVDYRYYAVADGYTSPRGLTQTR